MGIGRITAMQSPAKGLASPLGASIINHHLSRAQDNESSRNNTILGLYQSLTRSDFIRGRYWANFREFPIKQGFLYLQLPIFTGAIGPLCVCVSVRLSVCERPVFSSARRDEAQSSNFMYKFAWVPPQVHKVLGLIGGLMNDLYVKGHSVTV